MAKYDSPNAGDMTPAGPVNQSTGAPGSAQPYPATDSIPDSLSGGTTASSAVVTPVSGSLVNADRVSVSASDTLVGAQKDAYGPAPDPLTGLGRELGVTGAGEGSGHAVHPNSANAPSLLDQIQAARRPS